MTTAPIAVGDKIQFKSTQNPSGYGPFESGQIVTVAAIREDESAGGGWTVDIVEGNDEAESKGWGLTWFNINPTTVQEDDMNETTTNRVTIDFSGTSRATARSYANDLISRVNKPDTNDVLKTIAEGGEVEAFAAAEALLDAMRHVSTRFGQSMARRRAGEKAAHIGYIVHGVLGNVADDLPAYQTGERSRVVEQAKRGLVEAREEVEALTAALESRKRENEHQGEVNQRLAADLTDLRNERGLLTQAASDERRRLCSEIDSLKATVEHVKASANDEIDVLKAALDQANAKLSVVEAERDAAAAVIGYVCERLEDVDRAGILGYWDGVKDATLPSTEG